MEQPEVDYAWNGDAALAYQVFGAGPVDLLYAQGYASHLDLNWRSPYLARFLRGLGDLARVIATDRRGWGCSERFSPGDVAPLEVQVDDWIAVMDACGSPSCVVFASMDTAPAAVMLAASHPARVQGLVLVDPIFAYIDRPSERHEWAEVNARVRRDWGTPRWDHFGLPWDPREFRQWFVPWCRASVAPGALSAESDAFVDIDVRDLLSGLQVPVLLVSNGRDDPNSRREAEREKRVAATIPGGRWINPPGDTNGAFHWYGQGPAVLSAVAQLIDDITLEMRIFDRVLATVLFSDIVGSTQTASALGDRSWVDVLESHHAVVRGLLARYRGHEVDTAGDGFLATFDGPARAVSCGLALSRALHSLELAVRVGIHTGEVTTIDGKVGGLAVHVGARVAALAGSDEVLVSSTVKDLTLGSGIEYQDRGSHELKGVPGSWGIFRAVDPTG